MKITLAYSNFCNRCSVTYINRKLKISPLLALSKPFVIFRSCLKFVSILLKLIITRRPHFCFSFKVTLKLLFKFHTNLSLYNLFQRISICSKNALLCLFFRPSLCLSVTVWRKLYVHLLSTESAGRPRVHRKTLSPLEDFKFIGRPRVHWKTLSPPEDPELTKSPRVPPSPPKLHQKSPSDLISLEIRYSQPFLKTTT